MRIPLASTALTLALAAGACDRDAPSANSTSDPAVAARGPRADMASEPVDSASEPGRPAVEPEVLWTADIETGNLLQWEDNIFQASSCGGHFNTGDGATVPSMDQARSGLWSVKMSISGNDPAPTPNGARLFRWCEPQLNRELFYSVWYYIPQRLTVTGWMTAFFWKSRTAPTASPDPFFYLDVRNAPNGAMRFMLSWWNGLTVEGPAPGQFGYRTWTATQEIPIGRWFQVQARYVCDGNFGGAIQVWQDGVEIFKLDGVRTRYPTGDCEWGISNYGTGINPSPVILYIDDAVISQSKIGL